MTRFPAAAAAVVALLAGARPSASQEPGVAPPAPAAGLAVTPRVLADTVGPFAAFGDPAAAADGGIVFRAVQDGGGVALCITAGGAPRVIVRSGDAVQAGGRSGVLAGIGARPGIRSGFAVAFTATFEEGGRAVLVARDDGARFDLVADGGEAFRRFGEQAAIDRAGRVLFHAELDAHGHPDRTRAGGTEAERAAADALSPPRRMTAAGRFAAHDTGLFVDHGRRLQPVVATDGSWLDIADGATLADSGAVAFRASRRVGEWGLWLAAGAAPQRLLATGDGIAAIGLPALNAGGLAACSVTLAGGGGALLRLRGGTAPPEWLIGREAAFPRLADAVAIDAAGRVAFVAHGGAGGDRLFLTAAAGVTGAASPRELLAAGSVVEGRVVATIGLSSAAFAHSDRLVVRLVFTDGVEAIALCHLRGAA